MRHDYATLMANAFTWARERLGSAEYATRCLAFVEDAYERPNAMEVFGGDSAAESADLYELQLQLTTPASGSFVFYDCAGPIDGVVRGWGHVGLALDDGSIIHAWDRVRVDGHLGIEQLPNAPGWSRPRFRGWVPVERIFQGSHPRNWNV